MEVYEVSSLVNRPGNDGPEVILPVEREGLSSVNVYGQRPLL